MGLSSTQPSICQFPILLPGFWLRGGGLSVGSELFIWGLSSVEFPPGYLEKFNFGSDSLL